MLWVDKHRPVTFDKLDYHKELSARLQQMAETGDIPHMLFYGPSGAGKKTRILVLLRALFGSGVEKMRLEHRSFKTPSKRTVDITSVASSYHIEINPGDAGIYDRYVVQEVIKEIAMYSALHGGIESSFSGGAAAGGGGAGEGASGGKPPFKVLVLTEVDRLTRDAQAALRRTMEAYSANCRLILCCESPSKVIDPVRSRCLGVRIAAPMESESRGVLEGIVRREGLTVPPSTLVKICKLAKGNLRRAILMLEAMRVQAAAPVLGAAEPPAMDWELYIQSIADEMTERKETSTLISVRKKLYDLLSNCIPADVIFKTLLLCLLARCGRDEVKHELVAWAAYYEHKLRLGQKEIFHLEAFVARALFLLKKAELEAHLRPAAAVSAVGSAGRPSAVIAMDD